MIITVVEGLETCLHAHMKRIPHVSIAHQIEGMEAPHPVLKHLKKCVNITLDPIIDA